LYIAICFSENSYIQESMQRNYHKRWIWLDSDHVDMGR